MMMTIATRSRKTLLLAVGITATLIIGSRSRTAGEPLVVIATSSGDVSVPVEIARTPAKHRQGLSDRDVLDAGRGMLFVWNEPLRPTFTMAGMRFPLDIIFIADEALPDAKQRTDANATDISGTIIFIAENLPPCPDRRGCATVTPPAPVRFVLEVNAGFVAQNGIARSDAVVLPMEFDYY